MEGGGCFSELHINLSEFLKMIIAWRGRGGGGGEGRTSLAPSLAARRPLRPHPAPSSSTLRPCTSAGCSLNSLQVVLTKAVQKQFMLRIVLAALNHMVRFYLDGLP